MILGFMRSAVIVLFFSILYTLSASEVNASTLLRDVCINEELSILRQNNDWTTVRPKMTYKKTVDLEALSNAGMKPNEIISTLVNMEPYTLAIGSEKITLDLNGRTIGLRRGSSIIGNGMKLTTSRPLNAFIRNIEDGSSHEVSGLDIDAAGLKTYASFSFKNINGLYVVGNSIEGNTNSAIVVASSADIAAKNILISNNRISKPSAGAGHLIMVKSLPFGKLISCVAMIGNIVVGTDPLKPTLEDYTKENKYTGDQIVLHGVDGFLVYNNKSTWSGSAGYTVSRLSKNGVLDSNLAEYCYEPGFNFGSSFEKLEITSNEPVNIGESISNGKAILNVRAILTSKKDGFITLRGNVRKGVFKKGDIVFKMSDPDLEIGMVESLTRAVENVIVIGNTANETGIQRRTGKVLAAYNVVRSTNIILINNSYTNNTIGRANRFVSLSVSQGAMRSEDVKKYGRASIQVAGPSASLSSL